MSDSNNRTLVFVPSFNDRELLRPLTSEIFALGKNFQPMVIDDGSHVPIQEKDVAEGTLLARVPDNFGLGMATHIAFDHALLHDYPTIVRIDADGQHPVSLIPRMISPVLDGSADIVVAERTNRNKRTGIREIVSRLVRGYLSKTANIMTGGKAPLDVNSGFFAANLKSASKINEFNLDRFPEPQICVLAPRNGLVVASLEMEQSERQHGSSTVTLAHAVRLFYRFNIFVLAELLQKSSVR
jgi:glycosyltransferase involved in cell wall biosynthesis